MGTLYRIRDSVNTPRQVGVHINIADIEEISPTAALLLAAELQRWNSVSGGRRLRCADVEKWNPKVRDLLLEIGFFSLLNVENQAPTHSNAKKDITFLPFQSGTRSEGDQADTLQSKIEQLVDPHSGSADIYTGLYDALVESMTNVVHHAYPENTKSKTPDAARNWWMSASYNQSSRLITVAIYDQGEGIPKTVPQNLPSLLERLISEGWDSATKRDARLIEAAVEAPRSSTNLTHRGNGLPEDIAKYIEKSGTDKGHLQIMSREGGYRAAFRRGSATKTKLTRLDPPLRGTLIEWTARVPPGEAS